MLTEILLINRFLKEFLARYKEELRHNYDDVCSTVKLVKAAPGIFLQIGTSFYYLPPIPEGAPSESSLSQEDTLYKWFTENVAPYVHSYVNETINSKKYQQSCWDNSLKQRLHSYTKKSLFKE